MRGTRQDTRTRRRQIASAALDIVASKGLKGLRVAELARRVGLVPSAVYRHFDGKEEVVSEILRLVRWRFERNVEAAVDATADPVGRLEELLMLQIRLAMESSGLPRILFSDESIGEGTRRKHLKALISAFLGRVELLFRDAQRAGAIRRDVPAPRLAAMFLGLFQSAALLWHLTGGAFDLERHARAAWTVFHDGLRPAGRGASRRSLSGRAARARKSEVQP